MDYGQRFSDPAKYARALRRAHELVIGGPVQLFSAEHLVRTHHEWACTAAPITDTATGRLLGVLDVSGPLNTISADTLRMVRCAVRVAESLLGTSDSGASLGASSSVGASRQGVRRTGVAVSSLELLGDRPAAVFADGSRVPLTLRRAEILALLDSRSQGWNAEELAYELHGDAGTPQAVRTEMFRVRSMLGDAVESNPYLLAAGLSGCSDSGRVLRLLCERHVAQALEAYTAPLLSKSAPLVLHWHDHTSTTAQSKHPAHKTCRASLVLGTGCAYYKRVQICTGLGSWGAEPR